MNQDTHSQKRIPFGQLYLFGLFPYWTIVGTIFLSLSLINGRGHRLAHLLEWPVGIHFLLLGIVLLLLFNFCLAGCAALILKWANGFNLKATIALLILGTYWYNIVLIPCSILQLIAEGSSPNGLSILGIVLLLLLNFCLAGCAALILKWANGFNLKAKIALLILGTYWYNIVLIPCSILQLIAEGSSPNGLSILVVGLIIFLLPSLGFIFACHRLTRKNTP